MAGIKSKDQRQIDFLAYYLDPKSETFGNAYQSALAAKFSETYAGKITTIGSAWLSEAMARRRRMLEKAESNLEEFLSLPSQTQTFGAFGPLFEGKGKKKTPIMKHDLGLINAKQRASEFVAERIGKAVYSTKQIISSPDQEKIAPEEAKLIESVFVENTGGQPQLSSG